MSAKKVADALSGVLADTYVLLVKTQNYHWNVVGPQFFSLHQLFESQYNDLFVAVDEIAERVRQLGYPAVGSMSEFLRLTVISESESASAPGMVADLAAANEKISSRIHACLDLAEDDHDHCTADLMVRRLAFHGKAVWMLRSELGDEPTSTTVPSAAATVSKTAKVAKQVKVKKAVAKEKVKPVAVKKSVVTKAPTPAKKKGKVAIG